MKGIKDYLTEAKHQIDFNFNELLVTSTEYNLQAGSMDEYLQLASEENEDYYIDTEFGNKEFQSFINVLKNRSVKDFNVNISSGDSILTLSTCANNNKYRVVLHAVRIK